MASRLGGHGFNSSLLNLGTYYSSYKEKELFDEKMYLRILSAVGIIF